MHPIAHAQARPDHPAIIMAGSGETVSYRAMDETANRFARLLRARGVGRDGHFGLLMENNSLYLQLVWGSQRSGAMMVRHLGYPEAAEAIERAIAASLVEGGPRTKDLGGNGDTRTVGAAIEQLVKTA